MRTRSLILSSACILLLLSSCFQKKASYADTVPYVEGILADKYCHEAFVLRGNSSPDRNGSITIIGREGNCTKLAEVFSTLDARDNIDGTARPDGIPDFAGETLACIIDSLSYRYVLKSGDESTVRAHTARLVMAGLDTISHLSPYDLEGLDSKPKSKIVILADSYMARYGGFDVDTLFNSYACGVDVIDPVSLMLDKVIEAYPLRAVNVALLYDGSLSESELYTSRFAEYTTKRGAGGSTLLTMPYNASDTLVRTMLDSWRQRSRDRIDAIIVDDANADSESLKAQIADLISIMNESSITYSRYLQDSCLLLDVYGEVFSYCYDFLRKNNLFTHYISTPQLESYRPVFRPDTKDGSIMLIPASYVQY